MANRFEVTKEMMENADSYMPIVMKEGISASVARACVRDTGDIHPLLSKEEDENDYNVPPMYGEDTGAKARIMLTILMSYYLKVWDRDKSFMCEDGEYDAVMESHIMNQIERFKATDCREKAFDILSDYKELEKYVNCAIYSVLREKNDPVRRLMEALGAVGSAESLSEILEKIKGLQDEISEENARQERIIDGEDDADDES
jgi:hypothetical protein